MKVLVVGATGSIGMAVVEASLGRGHEVTALVRSPEKLGALRARISIVEADVTDAHAVASAVAGQDAVISALGSSPDRALVDLPATAMRNLIDAMNAAGVRRLVGLVGAAVDVPSERKPIGGRIASFVVRLLARNVVEAKQRELAVVMASDLDWTMVRPPNVVDGPATGQAVASEQLRGFRITSGDVGAVMVTLAESRDWLRAAPYVSAFSRPAD